MTAATFEQELAAFRGLVAERLGLVFAEGSLDPLPDLLLARWRAGGARQVDAYLARLTTGAAQEWRALAVALTVGETYFFRHPDHFAALGAGVLPELARAGRPIRMLSAGCASGEEAYSLALTAAEHAPEIEVEVVGIDVNPAFLDRARLARYSPWSLRGMPPAVVSRYFDHDGEVAVLREPFRRRVRFEERNLLEDDPAFWHPGAFDVIVFRNVGIYFAPETTQALITRFARALTPGGLLFLGPAESLRGVSGEFRLVSRHEAFYYQRRGGSEPPSAQAHPGVHWAAAIGGSADRLSRLRAAPPVPPAAESPPGPRGWDRAAVLRLFVQERFAEALEALRALPLEVAQRPETRLLTAAAYTTMGRLEEAERTCRAVLATAPDDPGAHHLLALCRDQADDLDGAQRHDAQAAALDPAFAMPRLHLGLLALRRGDHQAARAALRAAATLLSGEAEERVVLYGGGFGRAALEALCRANLTRLEARP